ncbi:hypothetical protein A5722_32425 [Mycobacterium vulneris]|nr:hypothetical protein A5722_32425 [Mycolicibacterium vulneris]OCB67808.1 hypothetical protein A5729_06685 [Mycolicibacterium vulneris]
MDVLTRRAGRHTPREDHHQTAPGVVAIVVVSLLGLAVGLLAHAASDDSAVPALLREIIRMAVPFVP